MPLEKQTIDVVFDKGLDKKSDSKLTAKMLQLDDSVFDSSNTLSKAGGFTALSGTGAPAGGLAAFAFQNELLQLGTDYSLYSLASSATKWISRGYAPLTTVSVKQLVRNQATQGAPCSATTGGVSVYAYEDSRGGVRASVFDEGSGALIQADVSLSTTGKVPRVVVFNSLVCVLYQDVLNLVLRTLDPNSPTSFTASVNVVTDVLAGSNDFDACSNGAGIYASYRQNATGFLRTIRIDSAGTIAFSVIAAVGATQALHVNVMSGGEVGVAWADGTGLFVITYTNVLGALGSGTLDAAALDVVHVTSGQAGAGLMFAFEVNAAATYNHYLRTVVATRTPAISGLATLVRSVGLASQAFTLNGVLHVAVAHSSALQPTLFVVAMQGSFAGSVVARALSWEGGGLITAKRLGNVLSDGRGTISIPALQRGRLALSAGKNITPIGLSRINVGDVTTSKLLATELGGALHIAGGCPLQYDGQGVTEDGFHIYPENVTIADGGAGGVTAGTRTYAVCYEWLNAKGEVERSSPGYSAAFVGGFGRRAAVTIPTLRLTKKTSPRSEVSLAVYRTVDAGTIFYRVTSVAAPTANDPTADTVVYSDNTLDAALVSNEILYVTGPGNQSQLDNDFVHAHTASCVHQDRLVLLGLEDPYALTYSKKRVTGEAPGFSEAFDFRVPPDLGLPINLLSMDDKLCIGCQQGFWYVAGEGPNALGQSNGYSVPQKAGMEAGIDIAAPRSLVLAPEGLMFRSLKGIRMLDRGLNIVPIGAEVDPLATTCIGALVHRSKNQVLFYTGSNVLVWDYLFRQWSRLTGHSAVHAVTWNSLPVHLTSGAVAMSRSGASLSYNGTSIGQVIDTGWMKWAGIQGFQRVWRLFILGTQMNSATITVSIFTDYDETAASETFTVDTTGYSTTAPLQLRHHLVKQKCEAIRVKLTESLSTGSGFKLTGLSFEVGLKRGGMKLPAARTV